MKIGKVCQYILILYFLLGLSTAISVNCISNEASVGIDYDLDSSTNLRGEFIIGDDGISSSQSLEGSGANNIDQTAGNGKASVSSGISSKGALNAVTSSYASEDFVGIGQNLQAVGRAESALIGESGSASAAQSAGVLDGFMTSSQIVSVQPSEVKALQATNIAGVLGHTNSEAQSSDNSVKLTGGLNGVGGISGVLAAAAEDSVDSVSASASFKANSLESNAYSAAKSVSAKGDAYSYLSSDDQLASTLRANANGHVISNQNLQAKGDIMAYASSTSDDSNSKSFAVKSSEMSGSLSASAGSPATVENNLDGNVQSASSNLIPTPGSWVWSGYGGYLNSDPFALKDAQGRSHILVEGGNRGLYDNVDGNWFSLGGIITSDPYAILDRQGRMHILARGGNGGLWDNVFNTQYWTAGWHGLGGQITLDPSAALEPYPNGLLKIAARGSDGSLWMRDLNTLDMSGSWKALGGYITSSPYAIFDNQGKIHTFARGGNNALWDNTGTLQFGQYQHVWNSHGGTITSAGKPIVDPNKPNYINTYVRGATGALWVDSLYTPSGAHSWYHLGGYISPSGSGSPIYEGNPEPESDANGNIHVFVRGGDGALWDSVGVYDPVNSARHYNWYGLNGYITSDPSAMLDAYNIMKVAVRGGDGSLWVNRIYPSA